MNLYAIFDEFHSILRLLKEIDSLHDLIEFMINGYGPARDCEILSLEKRSNGPTCNNAVGFT
jgi:hypothetical protein